MTSCNYLLIYEIIIRREWPQLYISYVRTLPGGTFTWVREHRFDISEDDDDDYNYNIEEDYDNESEDNPEDYGNGDEDDGNGEEDYAVGDENDCDGSVEVNDNN